jgi:hypothetical protein
MGIIVVNVSTSASMTHVIQVAMMIGRAYSVVTTGDAVVSAAAIPGDMGGA